MEMKLRHHVADGGNVDLVAAVVALEYGAQYRRRGQKLIAQMYGQFMPFGSVGFRDEDEPAYMGVPVQQESKLPPCSEYVAVRSKSGVQYE